MDYYRIAFIPGDGVGTEVATEAVKVLDTVSKKADIRVEKTFLEWGCDYYLRHGRMMPENGLGILRGFDAIFLGCIGDSKKVPDHISLSMLLEIRKGFDQYVNLRPIKLYPGVQSPVKTATPDSLDIMVVRENTEGEYANLGGFFKDGTQESLSIQSAIFTRKGCERVIRFAFDLARIRRKLGETSPVGMVTNCTKSNALNYSMVFWDKIFNLVAEDYPDVKIEKSLVDAMSMWLVKNPEYFDVVVASNLFGDIITDLGAMLQGGMGFAAGANINPERTYPSMFEPIHGSAPKYAGKGVVNPVAAIEAVRMMLDHLGEKEVAECIDRAIRFVLRSERIKTKDMGGKDKTREMGNAIQQAVLDNY